MRTGIAPGSKGRSGGVQLSSVGDKGSMRPLDAPNMLRKHINASMRILVQAEYH